MARCLCLFSLYAHVCAHTKCGFVYLSGNDCIFRQEITSKILTEYFHNNRKHKRGIKKKQYHSFHTGKRILCLCSDLYFIQLNYLEASLCFLINRSLLPLSVSTTVSMNSDVRFTAQNKEGEEVFRYFK